VPASARYLAIRALDALSGTAAQPVNLGPATYVRIGDTVSAPGSTPPGNAPGGGQLATTGLPITVPTLAVGLLAIVARLRRRRLPGGAA
jgi:hypothetical protein